MPEPIPFTLVDSAAALQDCCQRLLSAPAVAVDTEFMRTNTYHAKLGLVQLADSEHCWLVDPVAITDLEPLRELLHAPDVLKVLHSCSEDLQVLKSSLNAVPKPILDTQIAAGFVGEPFAMGYARMVKALLDIDLDKHETRSDWLQRPLQASQLYYAAEDVHYLIRAYEVLAERIDKVGRRSWVDEDMRVLLAMATPEPPEQTYLRIKAAWQLDHAGLAVLQVLAAWRERQAREQDIPRGWLITDRDLMALAETRPKTLEAMSAAVALSPKFVRRHGERLLALIDTALDREQEWPQPLPERLPRPAAKLMKDLRAMADDVAIGIDLAPELLARKKDLEPMVRAAWQGEEPQLPGALATGWRRAVIGEPLLELARKTSF